MVRTSQVLTTTMNAAAETAFPVKPSPSISRGKAIFAIRIQQVFDVASIVVLLVVGGSFGPLARQCNALYSSLNAAFLLGVGTDHGGSGLHQGHVSEVGAPHTSKGTLGLAVVAGGNRRKNHGDYDRTYNHGAQTEEWGVSWVSVHI